MCSPYVEASRLCWHTPGSLRAMGAASPFISVMYALSYPGGARRLASRDKGKKESSPFQPSGRRSGRVPPATVALGFLFKEIKGLASQPS